MSDTIQPGTTLNQGEQFVSANGRYTLVYQADGNLVLHDGTAPTWAAHTEGSNTAGGSGRCVLQDDGNLVVYKADGAAAWSSGTFGKPGSYLSVQDDGNVVIRQQDGTAVWSTNTAVTINIAAKATVTASSQNTTTGQTADKAIDGIPVGFPVDQTKEWATEGGGVGSWIELTWKTPVTVQQVVLYDRPNPDDSVAGGVLVFSDSTSVTVGPLENAGAATAVTVPETKTTSLRFTVTAVTEQTFNVGLAEIEVFGTL